MFQRLLFIPCLFFALHLSPSAWAAEEETIRISGMEEGELILQRAKDLDDFLAHPIWIEEYYTAMARYYGGEKKFPRKSFDAILGQLNKAKEDIPRIKERLWETTRMGHSFQVEAALQSYGRNVDPEAWKKYQRRWMATLFKDSGIVDDGEIRVQLTKNGLEYLDKEISSFDALLGRAQAFGEEFRRFVTPEAYETFTKFSSPLSKKNKDAITQSFYNKLRQNGSAKGIAAAWLEEYLKKESVQDVLGSNDVDLIMDEIVKLRNNTKELFSERLAGHASESVILANLKSMVPTAKELLELPDPKTGKSPIFPQRMIESNRGKKIPEGTGKLKIDFKVPPRRFHAIWKGIPINECVGGACQSLDSLSIERWYTVGLEGTLFQQVERNGGNLGFVQMVPLTREGKIAYSTDFGAPVLRQRTVVIDPATKEPLPGKFLDLWEMEASKHLPENSEGFLVSTEQSINNAGVKTTLFQDPSFNWATERWPAKEWKHLDPDVPALVEWEKKQGKKGYYYGGNMVTDGTNAYAKELRLLRFFRPGLYDRIAANPAKLRALLTRGNTPLIEPFLTYVSRTQKGKPEAEKILRELSRDTKHPNSESALSTLIGWYPDDPELGEQIKNSTLKLPMVKRLPALLEHYSDIGKTNKALFAKEIRLGIMDPEALAALGKAVEKRAGQNLNFSFFKFLEDQKADIELQEYLFQNGHSLPATMQDSISRLAFTAFELGQIPATNKNVLILIDHLRNSDNYQTTNQAMMIIKKFSPAGTPVQIQALIDVLEKTSVKTTKSLIWDYLKQVDPLPAKEITRLEKILGNKFITSDISAAMEAIMRKAGSENKNYTNIVNRALEDFAQYCGMNGWDYYKMNSAGEILKNVDFTKVKIKKGSLEAFMTASASDSRASEIHKEIKARIAATNSANGSMANLAHRAEVDANLKLFVDKPYEGTKGLAKILNPTTDAKDFLALQKILELNKQKDFLKDLLNSLLSREDITAALSAKNSAPAEKTNKLIAEFLQKNPALLGPAFAKTQPALTEKILETNFSSLLKKGNDALTGYISTFQARPDLSSKLRSYYEKNPEARLSYSLPAILPEFRLSESQLDRIVKEDKSFPYYLYRQFFTSSKDNTELLIAYARKNKLPRIISSATEEIIQNFPELITPDLYTFLVKHSENTFSEGYMLRKMKKEKAQELGTILLQLKPEAIRDADSIFPLPKANMDLIQEALNKLDPAKIEHGMFQEYWKNGFNPPKSDYYYSKEFIEFRPSQDAPSTFQRLMEKDQAYAARILEIFPTLQLSSEGQLKVILALPLAQAKPLLTPERIEEAMQSQKTSDALLRLAVQDKELGEAVYKEARLMPERNIPYGFRDYIPAFQQEALHEELLRVTPEDIFDDIKRGFREIKDGTIRAYAAEMATASSLSPEARYVAAAMAFERGQQPKEMQAILAKLFQDPRFQQNKDEFITIALSGFRDFSAEKVSSALDLLEIADRQGAEDRFSYRTIFLNGTSFSAGADDEKGAMFLKEVKRRLESHPPAPGTPAANVYTRILEQAAKRQEHWNGLIQGPLPDRPRAAEFRAHATSCAETYASFSGIRPKN